MVNNQKNQFSQLMTFLVFAFLFLFVGTLSSPKPSSSTFSHSHGSSTSSASTSIQSSSAPTAATRKKSTKGNGGSKNVASDVPRVTRHSTREALRRAELNPLSLKRAWYLFDHRNARRAPSSLPGTTGLAMRRAMEQPADLIMAWHLLDRPTPTIRPVTSTQMDASRPTPQVDGGSSRTIQELEAENIRLQDTIDGLKKEMDLLKAKNARLAQARTTTRTNLPVSSPVAPTPPRPSALSSYNRTPVITPIVPPTSRPLQEQLRERREKGKENAPPPYSPTPSSRVGRPDNAPTYALPPIRMGLLIPTAESSAAAAARAPFGSAAAAASSTTLEAVRSSAVSSISSAAFSAAVRHRQTLPSPAVASPSNSSSASRKRPSPDSAASESKRPRTGGSTSPTARTPAAQVAPDTAVLDQDEALAKRLQEEEDDHAMVFGLYLSRKGM